MELHLLVDHWRQSLYSGYPRLWEIAQNICFVVNVKRVSYGLPRILFAAITILFTAQSMLHERCQFMGSKDTILDKIRLDYGLFCIRALTCHYELSRKARRWSILVGSNFYCVRKKNSFFLHLNCITNAHLCLKEIYFGGKGLFITIQNVTVSVHSYYYFTAHWGRRNGSASTSASFIHRRVYLLWVKSFFSGMWGLWENLYRGHGEFKKTLLRRQCVAFHQ